MLYQKYFQKKKIAAKYATDFKLQKLNLKDRCPPVYQAWETVDPKEGSKVENPMRIIQDPQPPCVNP